MPQCGVVGGCPFFDAPCFFHPRPVTPFFPPSCDTIMAFSYKGKDVTQWCLFHTNDNGHKVGMPKMQETKVCHLKQVAKQTQHVRPQFARRKKRGAIVNRCFSVCIFPDMSMRFYYLVFGCDVEDGDGESSDERIRM